MKKISVNPQIKTIEKVETYVKYLYILLSCNTKDEVPEMVSKIKSHAGIDFSRVDISDLSIIKARKLIPTNERPNNHENINLVAIYSKEYTIATKGEDYDTNYYAINYHEEDIENTKSNLFEPQLERITRAIRNGFEEECLYYMEETDIIPLKEYFSKEVLKEEGKYITVEAKKFYEVVTNLNVETKNLALKKKMK